MYGPYSDEMRIKLLELNDVLGYMINKIKKKHKRNSLNYVFFSRYLRYQKNKTFLFIISIGK